MRNYHLAPDGARWKLTRENDGTLLFFETKEDAVEGCAAYMGEHPGSLKIHRANGSFEEERTYPRSMDPIETKG